MTEFRYRIDDARELALTGEPLTWLVHDVGREPHRWDVPTERERAMFDEIDRLRAENAALRTELKRRADLEPGGHVSDADLDRAKVTK